MDQDTNQTETPTRAHRLTLEIGADTQEDLIASLHQIIWDLQRGSTGATSGSPSAGYHFTYVIDPEMTHERYIALLEAWIATHQ